MDVTTFILKVEEFSSAYNEQWFKPLAAFKEKYFRENPDVAELAKANRYFPSSKYKKALDEFYSKINRPADLIKDIFNFIDQNYIVYSEATPSECEAIRNTVTNCYYADEYRTANHFFEDVFFQYVRERAIPQLQATGHKIWLTRGLIAMSIENSGIDYRDSILALADLRKIANEKNIDPDPEFERIAAISSNEKPRGGETPMKQLMARKNK